MLVTLLDTIPGFTKAAAELGLPSVDTTEECDFAPTPDVTGPATPEEWMAVADKTPGCGRFAESLRATAQAITELRTKISLAQADQYQANVRHIPGWEAKIEVLETKRQATCEQIGKKVKAATDDDAGRESSEAERAFSARAQGIIDVIAASNIDGNPEDMMSLMVPELYNKYVRCGGVWYKMGAAGSVEQVNEFELIEEVHTTMADRQVVRVIATALELCRGDDAPVSVVGVLKNWLSHLRSYTKAHEYLRTDESMRVCDWLFPMEVDGQPMVLDRKTGRLTNEPPEGCLVLYPAVTAASTGESRSLDAMVAHHFKTPEEVKTFYRTCGISLYGYGVPNLVFLLGSGGSGKDALFSLMRSVHGDKLTVMLNAQALMGQDESNDLVKLQNARIAMCAFESSHVFDGAFQPNTLKSITSGGMNPLTARAKYARAAVDIDFRGSLWLYGNHVPNLTGGGDFDGLDRRFMVLPMRKKLPRVAPPAGFDAWPDAITACAPVFAHRCLEAYISWHVEGMPGFADVRERIPTSWAEFSASKLTAGSRFGFLTDIFQPDQYGLKVETVLDVMSVLMKSERSKLPRSKFLQVLADTMRPGARFPDKKHMEPDDPRDDGTERLPLTVVESRLNRWLDPDVRNSALAPLAGDGGWDRGVAEANYVFMQSELARTLAKYETPEEES